MLEKGAEVSTAAAEGFTPLHAASAPGHVEVARWFLEKGAAVNAAVGNGVSALCLATFADHHDVVTVLCARMPDGP